MAKSCTNLGRNCRILVTTFSFGIIYQSVFLIDETVQGFPFSMFFKKIIWLKYSLISGNSNLDHFVGEVEQLPLSDQLEDDSVLQPGSGHSTVAAEEFIGPADLHFRSVSDASCNWKSMRHYPVYSDKSMRLQAP